MQTTPPMVMARAPKAGAVQPLTRKMAAVAMRVAMVMPETGEAELPTMPTMRALTVTKRKPKTTTRRAAAKLASSADLGSGDGLELEEEKHQQDEEERAAEDDDGGKVVLDARGLGGCGFAGAGFFEALGERADDGGQGAEEGDESGGGDGSCSHGTDVGAPEIGGGHLRDEDGAGVERGGEMRAEEVDGRHEDEPGEDSAGEHDGGDADADDVADAEVFGGAVGADGGAFEEVLGAEVEVAVGSGGPEGEEVFVLEEGVEAAEAEAEEDAGGEGAAAFAGDEDVGAGGAFGVDEGVVLFDDELAAERDHEEDAEPAAEEGEGEDAGGLEIEAEEDEGGQGEDDAGGDGLAGVAGGLDDVVFEDAGFAEGAEDGDGEDGDGDGGGDGEAGAEADVDGDGSEEDAEECRRG